MNSQKKRIEFLLEPVDERALQNVETNERVWETILGKANRIAIGYPETLLADTPLPNGLLLAKDLQTVSPATTEFIQLSSSLTLLPDTGCRFSSVDFIIEILEPVPQQALPRIIRLQPFQRLRSHVGADPLDLNTLFSAGAHPTAGTATIEVEAGSYGAGTRKGGWRFRISRSREIPMESTGLQTLIASIKGQALKLRFTVNARIEVLSGLDKWLTLAFRGATKTSLTTELDFDPAEMTSFSELLSTADDSLTGTIRRLIAEAKTDEALQKLIQYYRDHGRPDKEQRFILLLGKFNQAKEEHLLQMISHEEFGVITSNIHRAVLELMEE